MPLVKPPQDYLRDRRRRCRRRSTSARPSARGWSSRASTSARRRASLGAGYIPKLHWTDARANSEGLFAYFRYAEASFILTCRTPDGTGSGWAGTTGVKDITKIDAAALTEVAADKALKSRKPRAIEPGNYTVILEPRPAARFLSLMLGSLNARAAEEGRSFMSGKRARRDEARPEGVRRQRHDPQRHRQPDPAPDADRPGRPRRASPITWVEKGVVKNLVLRPLLGEASRSKAPTPTHAAA